MTQTAAREARECLQQHSLLRRPERLFLTPALRAPAAPLLPQRPVHPSALILHGAFSCRVHLVVKHQRDDGRAAFVSAIDCHPQRLQPPTHSTPQHTAAGCTWWSSTGGMRAQMLPRQRLTIFWSGCAASGPDLRSGRPRWVWGRCVAVVHARCACTVGQALFCNHCAPSCAAIHSHVGPLLQLAAVLAACTNCMSLQPLHAQMGGRSTDVTVSWPPGRDAASKAA